jgi:hypothetical protein
MNWNQSAASKCKWSKYTEEMFKGWDIVWDNSTSGFSNQPPHYAEFVAKKDGQIAYIKYAYNLNASKDRFEKLTDVQRRREISMKVEVFADALDFKAFAEYKNDGRLRKVVV